MSHSHIRLLTEIRSEFEAARASLSYLESGWNRLHFESEFNDLEKAQVRRASANLEATYIARLFSAFETVIRDFPIGRRTPRPDRRSAYDLINQTASRFHIRGDIRDQAHQVREFRNQIVHQGSSTGIELSFSDALAALNRFVSWFPNPP